MNFVEVEFIPNFGLVFRKIGQNNEKIKVHDVKLETLQSMSLADLEHCLSANLLIELDGLHALFSDYLWGDDGEVEPNKKRDEPR